METKDILVLIGVLTVILFMPFAGYKIGRYLERRDLTEEFKKQFEYAYIQGIQDGYKKGYKEASVGCDQEPLFSGRY